MATLTVAREKMIAMKLRTVLKRFALAARTTPLPELIKFTRGEMVEMHTLLDETLTLTGKRKVHDERGGG